MRAIKQNSLERIHYVYSLSFTHFSNSNGRNKSFINHTIGQFQAQLRLINIKFTDWKSTVGSVFDTIFFSIYLLRHCLKYTLMVFLRGNLLYSKIYLSDRLKGDFFSRHEKIHHLTPQGRFNGSRIFFIFSQYAEGPAKKYGHNANTYVRAW